MLRLEFKEEFDCVSRAVTPSIKTLWLSGVLTLKKVKSINTNLFMLHCIAVKIKKRDNCNLFTLHRIANKIKITDRVDICILPSFIITTDVSIVQIINPG